MTDAFIFTGPSLSLAAAADRLGQPHHNIFQLESGHSIKFMPPAAEGDIAALVDQKPALIAIIDGYFENLPAVWHKEILYAMAKGIHIMGASSMGALRAAELATFGMQGIGYIYHAYAEGRWTDDDEVTIAHGPADLGFPAVSDAMANIRVTLDHALASRAITLREWSDLTGIAKNLFYKNRTYHAVLDGAASRGLTAERRAHIEAWLVNNRRDQKQTDALELLDAVAAHLQADVGPKKVLYHFQDTLIWQRARSLPQIA